MKIKCLSLISVALFSFKLSVFAEPNLIISYYAGDVLTFGGIDGPSVSATRDLSSPAPGVTFLFQGQSSYPSFAGVSFDFNWPGTSDHLILYGGRGALGGQVYFDPTPPVSSGNIVSSAVDGYTVQLNDDRFTAVPEPPTLIILSLPLLLFGAQTVRAFRKTNRAA
jgi:hypothetical protein